MPLQKGRGALSEKALDAVDTVEDIDLRAFLMADLPVEITAMVAAE